MIKRIFQALLLAPLLTTTANAQSVFGEGINTAIEAVQSGLDLIWPDELSLEDVNARIGFGMGTTPDYVGSDDYSLRVVPLIDIRYKDDWRLNSGLLTFSAVRHKNIEMGPLVNLKLGRSESKNPALQGLGDIGTTFEVGGFVRYKTPSALLSAEYRHGLGAGIRGSLRLTAGHGVYKNGNFAAMLVARARWLSKGSMQIEFGITPAQSASSALGLSAFETGSGFSDVSLNLVGALQINEKARLLSLISYGRMLDDAKNSPIVDQHGSAAQVIAGAGLAFNF